MKSKYLMLCLAFFACLPINANLPEDIQKADARQKKILLDLQNEIAAYHLSIQSLYKYLYKKGIVKKGKTRIPLLAERRVNFVRKLKHVYNAEAVIHWNGKKISYIHFAERNSDLKNDHQNERHWLGQLEVTEKAHSDPTKQPSYIVRGYSVDFITFTYSEFGNLDLLLFRVNTATDTAGKNGFLKLPPHNLGRPEEIRYVENPNQRISILRDYLRLVILLEHRAKYFTRKLRIGAEDRLQYLLPKP